MRLLIYALYTLYTYIVAVRAVLYIFEKSSYEVVLTVRLVTYKCIFLRNTCMFFMSAKGLYHSYSDFSSVFLC